jgi:RimJ/RimL family protein N-acetyltransferase
MRVRDQASSPRRSTRRYSDSSDIRRCRQSRKCACARPSNASPTCSSTATAPASGGAVTSVLDAERTRRAIGAVVVPFGTCSEPSNVAAGGGACPLRFRCVGCDHFSTDVSYLPDLRTYLDGLLRQREKLRSMSEADDWARAEATPSDAEITRIRRLIQVTLCRDTHIRRFSPLRGNRRAGSPRVDLDGAMIGQILLRRAPEHRRPAAAGKVDLGYLFLPEAWGYGYAAEACAAALDWFDGVLPGEPAVLHTQTANVGSMRLAAKLGFTEVERFHAWDAEQWLGLRSPVTPSD